jgi:DNA-binding transcriptional ArsR family regulator
MVDAAIQQAAELFKALSSASRLLLLQLLTEEPATVTSLVEASELSQPLVSQHLRVLRAAGLVDFEKHGREATYLVTDAHVSHIVSDAITHVRET